MSSSRNAREVLAAAGLTERFAVVVDGLVAQRDEIAGKPAPDTFLAACDRLGVAAAAPPLATGPAGNRFDTDPGRSSDLVVFAGTPDSPALTQDIARSRLLDAVFPGLLKEYGNATAMYFISADGLTRYYPPIGLHDIVPNAVTWVAQRDKKLAGKPVPKGE